MLIWMFLQVHAYCIYIYVCMYVVCMYAEWCEGACGFGCFFRYVNVVYMCLCVCMCVCICVCMHGSRSCLTDGNVLLCMYVCMYACMYGSTGGLHSW